MNYCSWVILFAVGLGSVLWTDFSVPSIYALSLGFSNFGVVVKTGSWHSIEFHVLVGGWVSSRIAGWNKLLFRANYIILLKGGSKANGWGKNGGLTRDISYKFEQFDVLVSFIWRWRLPMFSKISAGLCMTVWLLPKNGNGIITNCKLAWKQERFLIQYN
jgi:hypothetical protein